MEAVFAALALGLVGSLHCASMCGPLAMAACQREGALKAKGATGYFAGRLVGYAFVGTLFGTLGMHWLHQPGFVALQRTLWLSVALFALLKGVGLLFPRARRVLRSPPWATRLLALLSGWTPRLPRSGLPIGLVTAVLPCGMLAGGWALASTSGSPWGGAVVMALFCVASTPALLGALLLLAPFQRLRARLAPPVWGVMWCVLALWIGARPLLEHAGHHHP